MYIRNTAYIARRPSCIKYLWLHHNNFNNAYYGYYGIRLHVRDVHLLFFALLHNEIYFIVVTPPGQNNEIAFTIYKSSHFVFSRFYQQTNLPLPLHSLFETNFHLQCSGTFRQDRVPSLLTKTFSYR